MTGAFCEADLARHPNPLATHYRRFRVAERLLLTGHSHQAWPDCGRQAQLQAWDDAADWVDDKWERAAEMARRVAAGYARLLDDPQGAYALGSSTHELVVRFLSALPLRERPRLVTTDGEFHSIRRQLDRLAEEGIEVVKVPSAEPADIASRLIAALDDRTAAVLVSSVLFESARIVPGLGAVMNATERHGAALLIDVYHSCNVAPFSLPAEGVEGSFVVGGGYKYCQLGEGCCFLRLPPGCTLRPVVTGWFAEFESLAAARPQDVPYGEGAARFAGSTYDPTSHYRGAAVFGFFAAEGLTQALLRRVSQHQIALLAAAFDALDADPRQIRRDHAAPLKEIAGFLVLESPQAAKLATALAERGVSTDYRHTRLRLGPAPYLSNRQLRDSVAILGEVLRTTC